MMHIAQVQIVLNDLYIESFECIRDYCYGLQPKLNQNIIFKVLLASIKYMMDSMVDNCIDFIKNEWIANKDSLFSFLKQLSDFESSINSNVITTRF